ncbi:MAG: adenylyl-sulfate kinase, partial [Burkholderiales bacterium]
LITALPGGQDTDDSDYFSRMRSYQAVLPRYPAATSALALMPINPRWSGARDVAHTAIIQRNYGCTHMIIAPECYAPGASAADVYGWLGTHLDSIGVKLIALPELQYIEERAQYLPSDKVPPGARAFSLDPHELTRRLDRSLEIPHWFTFPEVISVLRKFHPPRSQQGFTVFFTGLSGSGKSTLARVLNVKLMEMGGREVTLLDGDLVRKHLSSELGFSKEHRDINIRRIGYVASEITKHRGVALCAPIAPYRETRRAIRKMIESCGGFFEVHVSTPIEECEKRDRKGWYAKARAGLIKEFTGVSDPYETPERAELVIDTSHLTVEEAVQRILLKLEHEGYIG